MTAVATFVDPVAVAVALLDDLNNVALFDELWDSVGGDSEAFSHALVAAQELRRRRAREVDALHAVPPAPLASTRPGSGPPAALRAPVRRGPRHGAVATGRHANPPSRACLGDWLLFTGTVLCALTVAVQLWAHARWR